MLEALVGAAFGVIGGMGMGGGIVLIPALVLMGAEQHTAQALCLLAFLPARCISTRKQSELT